MQTKKGKFAKILKEFVKHDTPSETVRPPATSVKYDPVFVAADPQESICGTFDESQPVERYDGTLGVSKEFVAQHQSPVGQIRWNTNLSSKYSDPGNVSDVKWGSGTLISNDLFITAGHCFDSNANGWHLPKSNSDGQTIVPKEIATNMNVAFNYQLDSSGNIRPETSFNIKELIEYREGNLDFAIVRLEGNPGQQFGVTSIHGSDPPTGEMLAIIGHPEGRPKTIEAGPVTDYADTRIGYNDIDTFGGSSGSGILHFSTGKIVGVHTNGGCDNMGFNYGQRITSLLGASQTLRNLVSTLIPLPSNELRSSADGGNGPLVLNDPRSTLVKILQTILKKIGFDLGNSGANGDGIDGKFGNKTFDSVVKFQNTHKDLNGNQLNADGKVGRLTAEALNKEVGV